MKKIFYFLFISSLCFSQQIVIDKTVVFKSSLFAALDKKMDIIESVNGQTWLCYPKEDLIFKGGSIIMINGFPVIYSGDEKSLRLPDKKIDLIQLNFKDKKKVVVKGGSYKDCLGFPKDAEKKVKEDLKNIEKHKKVKE